MLGVALSVSALAAISSIFAAVADGNCAASPPANAKKAAAERLGIKRMRIGFGQV
jgi:hypothetical protein